MIYLIGGPPRSGKSTLAHKLSKKLGCPEISIDWLRSVVLPYVEGTKKETLEEILQLKKVEKERNLNMREPEILWPAVKSFAEDKSRWTGDFVIDGIHLLPKYVKTIDKKALKNIRIVYLVKTKEEKILEGFKKTKNIKSDWLLKRNWNKPEVLKKAAKIIANEGKYFEEEAKKHKLKAVNTENNFEKKIDSLVEKFYQERKELRKKERLKEKQESLQKTTYN